MDRLGEMTRAQSSVNRQKIRNVIVNDTNTFIQEKLEVIPAAKRKYKTNLTSKARRQKTNNYPRLISMILTVWTPDFLKFKRRKYDLDCMEYVVLGLQFVHDEQLLNYLETIFETNSLRFDLSARECSNSVIT